MPRENKHRTVYLWSVDPEDDVENMIPFEGGVKTFDKPLTKPDMASVLYKIADDNPTKDIYFSFRKGYSKWRAYKTSEVL
jgi:hypothetical protein